MRLDDHKLFQDIAKERSFSEAAKLNNVTQSAASQHVRELEKQFQVRLIDRSHRPLVLTEAGKAYQELCQRILKEQEAFELTLARLRGQVTGVVRFATIYSVGLSEVTGLKREFGLRHPEVTLEIEYLRPERVYDAVLAGRADAGVVSYPRRRKDLQIVPWRQEEMVVAVAPAHPLAQFPTVHPAQLDGQDFIAFDGELPIARHIDHFLRDQKVAVRKLLHFDNIDSLREVVARGMGAAIVPKPILRAYIEDGRILALPLIPKGLRRPLAIVYRKRHQASAAAAAFLHFMQENAHPGSR